MKRTLKGILAGIWLLAIVLMLGASAGAEGTAVAKIGESEYESLDEAIAAAEDGDTVTLLADATAETFYKSLTFTGGHTLSMDAYGWRYKGKLVLDGVNFRINTDADSPKANNGEAARWVTMVLGGSIVAKNGAHVTFTFDSAGGTNCAIYAGSGGVTLEVRDGSSFEIYGQNTKGVTGQGIQLDSTANTGIYVTGGSEFLIDGTNRGYVNSPTIYVEDSKFTVQNCTSNASNGGQFTSIRSQITFYNNAGHGLSATNLLISDNSNVTCNQNAYYGVTVGSTVEMDGTSRLTSNQNGYGFTGGALRIASTSGKGIFHNGAVVELRDNKRNALENYGVCTFEENAKLEITGNQEPSNGAGIYNGAAGRLVLPENAVIMRNVAASTGGGICNRGIAQIPASAQLYNNHAGSEGDDIANSGTISFGAVGGYWKLDGEPDCEDVINGWYDDSQEDGRWEAHASAGEENHVVRVSAGTYTQTLELKAAHDLSQEGPGSEEENDFEIEKSADSRLDEQYQANVTLKMPSYADELETDVVFVLDKSMSTEVSDAAAQMLEELHEQVKNTGAKVKVGVVSFNKAIANRLELTELTDGNLDAIDTALHYQGSTGTNIHAGLLAGQAMLDGGAAAPGRKYLILVSDGIAYIFGENGSVVATEYYNDNVRSLWTDPYCWGWRYGSSTYIPQSWDGWFSGIAASAHLADSVNLAVAYDERGTNTDKYIPYEGRAEYPSTVDLALYYAAVVYKQVESRYNAYAVLKANNTTYPWGPSFMDYLAGGEDVSFDSIKQDMRYIFGAGTEVTDVIGFGTNGDGVAYSFDFVNRQEALVLEYGKVNEQGELVDKTGYAVDKAEEIDGNTHFYFGEGEGEEGYAYAFELTYHPETGNNAEYFTLTFGRNIELGEQVKLTYKVELEEAYRETEAGLYDGLNTNTTAYIDPVDSEGDRGDRQYFPVPATEYENIRLDKTWSNDSASLRPQAVEIELLKEGQIVQIIRLTQQEGWTVQALNVRAYDGINEKSITLGNGGRYEPEVCVNPNEHGFTIQNTYVKPVEPDIPRTNLTFRKVWDDVGNANRPDSITLVIGKGDDSNFRTLNLSYKESDEKDKTSNTWTFHGYGWVDAQYTVTEVSVPGYASKVEVSENDPDFFTITNTYMPATGDNTPVGRYLLMIGCAALMIAAVCVVRSKRQSA